MTCLLSVIGRYSDSTIDTLQMMDDDEKINLELIVGLIRHIVMKEDVSAFLVSLAVIFVCLSVCPSDLAKSGPDGEPRVKQKHVGIKCVLMKLLNRLSCPLPIPHSYPVHITTSSYSTWIQLV